MGFYRGPNIVTDGLVFAVDAGSGRSYSGSGTTAYDLITSETATLTNGVTFSNNTWVFDGVDDYINLNTSVVPTGGVGSIEAWAKFTSNNAGGIVGFGDGGYTNWGGFDNGDRTGGYPDEVLAFINRTTGTSRDLVIYGRLPGGGEEQLNDGNYHHVVAVVDGVENTIYLDGNKMTTINFVQGSATTTGFMNMDTLNKLRIGNSTYGNGHIPLAGEIPIVRIYNKGLSAAEVLQNYNAQKSRFGL